MAELTDAMRPPAFARLFRCVLALGAAVALVLSGQAAALAAPTPPFPTDDPFYTYSGSTPLSQIKPGTVLKSREITAYVNQQAIPFPASQLLYRTTGQLGQPTVTVTTVLRPLTPSRRPQLLSLQTAYDALGPKCDPSYTFNNGNPEDSQAQSEAQIAELWLLHGYYVNVADYEGEALDWAAGQESGMNTLDSVRAAEASLHLPAKTPVGLEGYSGGSIASEWAAELAPTYAPELHLIGAAIGGIPVDLAHNLTYINGSDVWSGIIPAVLVSLSRAFHVQLAPYLSDRGAQLAATVADQCIADFNGNYPGLKIQDLLKPQYQDPFQIAALVTILNKLIMGSTPGQPAIPLMMDQGINDGTGDGVMIAADVRALALEYCGQGLHVQYKQYDGKDHTQTAPFWVADSYTFLTAAFAGAPPAGNCADIPPGSSLDPLPDPTPTPTPTSSAPSSGSSSSLAGTGTDSADTSLLAVLLIATGSLLLFAGWYRRRPAARHDR